MALRGKKPEDITTRLKFFMFGLAGVGKTMAAIQMPKPYILDCESGTNHYGDIIEDKGGRVYQTTDLNDAIVEVRSLLTTAHPYKTLVIDPFTVLYETEVEVGERKLGTEWGRHYGYANKGAKRLYNLISRLDMNVVFTTHAKGKYEDGEKVGETFDGWKKLDYMFDLGFWLQKEGKKRFATVVKTRLVSFPDETKFEWSYDALAERYGRERLEAEVRTAELATDEHVERMTYLFNRLSDSDKNKLKLKTLDLTSLSDFTADRIGKGISLIENHLGV